MFERFALESVIRQEASQSVTLLSSYKIHVSEYCEELINFHTGHCGHSHGYKESYPPKENSRNQEIKHIESFKKYHTVSRTHMPCREVLDHSRRNSRPLTPPSGTHLYVSGAPAVEGKA
jgi:hypothetical protein